MAEKVALSIVNSETPRFHNFGFGDLSKGKLPNSNRGVP